MDNFSVRRPVFPPELDDTSATFHALGAGASSADLRRRTAGIWWTNRQMLFHMRFGYLIVRTLLCLVRLFGPAARGRQRAVRRCVELHGATFHVIPYFGSRGGALIVRGPRLDTLLHRIVAALHRHLDAARARSMHFPFRWDPFFRDRMRLAEVYHFGTEHFEFHRSN